jgi:endonuclease/exonuclease/phosphatase family metal-dependent hydrolase
MRKSRLPLIFLALVVLLTIGARIQNIRQTGDTEISTVNNKLTFMTFNIRVGGGIENPGMNPAELKSSREKMEKIASAIESIDPDVLALQEVKGFSQAKQLAKRLNLNYVYMAHKDFWGLAILSKHKILKAEDEEICKDCKVTLSSNKVVTDPRIAIVSAIDINGKQITFINVHYHLGVYEQQVKATMKVLNDVSGPVVLMGDLNRKESDLEMKPIQNRLNDTCLAVETENSERIKKIGTKIGGKAAGLRIDYIFVDPDSFEVVDVGIAEKYREASDHYGYVAYLRPKAKQ